MGIEINKNELMIGDIFLYHGSTFLSRAIRFFDRTDYNHSAIYIGDNNVIEAVAQGVIIDNINSSSQGQKIFVRRLNNRPPNMKPVIGIANNYVGKRYGYEQLLLLILISTTRRVRINNFLLRFVNKLLEKVSIMILNMTNGGKQSLICSELVYRSYDEARRNSNDEYTIYLERNKSNNNLINNESLLSKFYSFDENAFINKLSTSPFVDEGNIEYVENLKNDLSSFELNEDFENEIENLFDDVIISYNQEDYIISKIESDLFKKNMDIFLTSYYHLKNKNRTFLAPKNTDDIINNFLQENANFVSPGDLSKAKNLLNLGELS